MRAPHLERGSSLPLVLVLLLLLGAAGWNYQRNWRLEQAEPRPYRAYDDQELALLVEAYQQESSELEARAEAMPAPSSQTRSGALLQERVDAFQRARRAGEAKRRLASQADRRTAVLEALRAEQARREKRPQGLALHWRRLTRF